MEFLKANWKKIAIAVVVLVVIYVAYTQFFAKKEDEVSGSAKKEKTELDKAIEWVMANDLDRIASEKKSNSMLSDYDAAKIASEYDLRTNNKYSKYLKAMGKV